MSVAMQEPTLQYLRPPNFRSVLGLLLDRSAPDHPQLYPERPLTVSWSSRP